MEQPARANAADLVSIARVVDAGEWSDLRIETPTAAFNVHKRIACSNSPVIAEAINENVENVTLRVSGSLPAWEALLQHVYQVRVDLLCAYNISLLPNCDAIRERVERIIELAKLARKYGVEVLMDQICHASVDCMNAGINLPESWRAAVLVGEIVFAQRDVLPDLAQRVQLLVATYMPYIVATEEVWQALSSNKAFMRAVLGFQVIG